MKVTHAKESWLGRTVRAVIGTIGAWFIYLLIWIFGRLRRPEDVPWIVGPLGGEHIGGQPYEETAAAENLSLERDAKAGGLVPDFSVLASETFDIDKVDKRIRDFYEGTAGYKLDTWATTYFPSRIALWLLVQTISRRVDQLNFPIEGLEIARGMTSEIVLLRNADGSIKYTGWFRRLRKTGRSLFTGFYLTEQVPESAGRSVKVVFPMPNGNATVLLRPENDGTGFRLETAGKNFGDVGFYRIQRTRKGMLRVWRIRSLHERFHLYVDEDGVVRAEHLVTFLG